MGHNLDKLGSASLDTLGGLITFAKDIDIPEGGSPRNWNVDYPVGSVISRPGLSSVYTYATTLLITGFSLVYGLATFTYVGTEPTINEGFILSGFTGPLSFLNGVVVVVENASITTFTANVVGSDITITGISGSAVSLSGQFVGPNLGSLATGFQWNNPSGILGNTTYASASSGSTASTVQIPGAAANLGNTTPQWTNPGNAVAVGASVATVTLSISANSGGGGGGTGGGGGGGPRPITIK